MLDNWHKMLPKKMREWGLERQEVREYVVKRPTGF
jgi:hypothetical protein